MWLLLYCEAAATPKHKKIPPNKKSSLLPLTILSFSCFLLKGSSWSDPYRPDRKESQKCDRLGTESGKGEN